MNERIKEFAFEARLITVDGITRYASDYEFEKRFADLIIRECIDKIETHRIPVGNSAAGEMACEWTYSALKEVRDEIKEHFGVVE
jgi:hypothetical protein